MSRILVVDDEPSICWGLSRLARSLGCRVDTASSAEEGLALAAAARPDLVVLDVRLPGLDGLSAMRSFRMHIGAAPIVVMTAFGDLATAVSAVQNGAFEYVIKPFDLGEIRAVIERALRRDEPTAKAPADAGEPAGMIGGTPAMHAVFKRIALAANSTAPVLLCGERGTGKEMAARTIHHNSSRRAAPFVAVNLASLSPDRAEAELFGHVAAERGGGLATPRTGLLAHADGGTLFFDDVDAIPLPLQIKLMRVLDQGEVAPLSASETIRVTFRVISATRLDLRQLIQTGAFRHDLFVRLGAYEISLPPLRERPADIPTLARHFAAQLGTGAAVLAAETLAEMMGRPWHGNVRELRTAIDHALVVARTGAVLPAHLPEPLPPLAAAAGMAPAESAASLGQAVASLANSLLEDSANSGDVYDRFLEKVEPPLLATVLLRNGNRCAPAARALGLHRTTLKRKLDQYGIDESPP